MDHGHGMRGLSAVQQTLTFAGHRIPHTEPPHRLRYRQRHTIFPGQLRLLHLPIRQS